MAKRLPKKAKQERIFRILACLETLIDIVLGPGWNNDYENFEHLEKVGFPQQYPIIWNKQHCWVQLSLLLSDRADTLRPLLNRLVEEYRLSPDLRSVTIDKLGRCWVVIKLPVASRQQLDNITARIRTAPEVRRIKTSKIPSVSWADGCLTKNRTTNVFSED